MYFVTTKQDGYVLFAMTPSERAAVGLTDKQEVHLLKRQGNAGEWQLVAKWNGADFSHTDFMVAWHSGVEPTAAGDLLAVLPAALRQRLST
jgi:hypothetical protein